MLARSTLVHLSLCAPAGPVAMASHAGLTCATAPGVEFEDFEELKQHYKTDWHRYNLKRKARGAHRAASL